MGISLSQLPCSQGALERAFSHLKIIIAKRKEHMLNDLLSALLFLRTNDRPTETATLTGFGALLEAIAERERRAIELWLHLRRHQFSQTGWKLRMRAGVLTLWS
jgi:hypothetical protein